MATDTEVERRLRDALHDHAGPEGLPDHVLVDALAQGRIAVRRRRGLVAAGAAASLAVVAGLAVAMVNQNDTQPQPAPAPPSPSVPVEPDPVDSASLWAATLPEGAPTVPYLAGTTVVEPDGSRVEVRGTEAEMVGLTVAGPLLLVGTEVQDPYSFSSRYVVVRPTGEVKDLPVPTATCCAAEEAVVSPDGRRFTAGNDILDTTDLSVVGHVPVDAKILVAWTPVGIVYLTDGGHYMLWPEGGTPIALRSNAGVFAPGGDVAIDMCGTIVRLAADGNISAISPNCVLGGWSVSPSGHWVITADLELVDVATLDTRSLSDRAVSPVPRSQKVWWDGDDSVTFPAGDYLVRCDTATASCERVAGPEESLSLP